MRKGCDGEKKRGEEKRMTKIVANSQPPEPRPLERRTLVPKLCHQATIVKYSQKLKLLTYEDDKPLDTAPSRWPGWRRLSRAGPSAPGGTGRAPARGTTSCHRTEGRSD